jgi:hypothetical protein
MPTILAEPNSRRPWAGWGGAPVGSHFVCLACRVAFKQYYGLCCPNCDGQLYNAGLGFRTPRKGDDQGWRIVEIVLTAGLRFNWDWPHTRTPRTPHEARALVKKECVRRRNEGMMFLDEHPRRRM